MFSIIFCNSSETVIAKDNIKICTTLPWTFSCLNWELQHRSQAGTSPLLQLCIKRQNVSRRWVGEPTWEESFMCPLVRGITKGERWTPSRVYGNLPRNMWKKDLKICLATQYLNIAAYFCKSLWEENTASVFIWWHSSPSEERAVILRTAPCPRDRALTTSLRRWSMTEARLGLFLWKN